MFIKKLLTFLFSFIYIFTFAQTKVSISGNIKDSKTAEILPFVNIILKNSKDSTFIIGVVSDENGRFVLSNIKTGNYILQGSYTGYNILFQNIYVGKLSEFLDLGTLSMNQASIALSELIITTQQAEINEKMDKKTFSIERNISQNGGSILQALQNLPGVSVQEGKVLLRGNDKVSVLIDGKQTALTGFGNQYGLDNIPASNIEKIEIINNPSAKFDANGNAGIINIIYKKTNKEGINGKVGLSTGLGSLWVRKRNLPDIRPQYTFTPKINPSLSINYKKNKHNIFFQSDYLFTQTLNKNEFTTKKYDNGDIGIQQLKRNRDTHFTNSKLGIDYNFNEQNSLTVSAFFGTEKILDHGDEPFFKANGTERTRLWQFLEDELKTTVMATAAYQHKLKQPGRILNIGYNYTFHREDEKYFFDNILPTSSSKDAFKLLSDEQVSDFNIDYIKPLKVGRVESGIKLRQRGIPTNMQFFPGINTVLDVNAGGKATYSEFIPAVYNNWVLENNKIEAELGLRIEYVKLNYMVDPKHNTYKSDGYNYTQPFPNMRLAYKFNDNNRLSLFFNRRVDRPNEVDIRIFPKYDDAGIIKVGNPALKPQFTNTLELSFKNNWEKGSFYAAFFQKFTQSTITRISSTVPKSDLIYAVFQNADKSQNIGVEIVINNDFSKKYSSSLNLVAYKNTIGAFSVSNKYPIINSFLVAKQSIISGNIKFNNNFHFSHKTDAQVSVVYLAPDIIPQGKIFSRFSIDAGIKKSSSDGKKEYFVNANDVLNTMIIKREILGDDFTYISTDYLETQVIRVGVNYKF